MRDTAGGANMESEVNGNVVIAKDCETPVSPKGSARQPLKWSNIVLLSVIHMLGIYSMFRVPTLKFITIIFHLVYGFSSGIGVTAGAHRLWTHRSYRANLPLRILLGLMYTAAGMNPLYEWVRDHRVHHKYSDTDADPHNASRGLFFSHMGWLLQKKHPEVIRQGKKVDMSDIAADPVVRIQAKFFIPGVILLSIVVPALIPYYLWNESLTGSLQAVMVRWMVLLHIVWSVNSFAHIYGYHSYDRNILPAENLTVAIFAMGEGWHNYHHTFPWDYKTGELNFYGTNLTMAFIDFFAYIGWVSDRKQPSQKLIEQVTRSKGDGTHAKWGSVQEVPESAEDLLEVEEKIKGI